MIEVLRPGLLTSIQDYGRFGYRDQGVPLSGAMDQYAFQLANQLLGNPAHAAVMEFVMQGPKLVFKQAARMVICGGDWKIKAEGRSVEKNRVFELPASGVLEIKAPSKGMYGYLAIEGGFKTEKVLGSCSFYSGITKQSKLQKGDLLKFQQEEMNPVNHHASVASRSDISASSILRVEKGPEFDLLNQSMQQALFNSRFSPSKDSNRMAYPLEHTLELSAPEITTAPVQPGTIQLTPSGNLIVLMRDAQTTGGYARVLQLSPMAINQLAQKRAGEEFEFEWV